MARGVFQVLQDRLKITYRMTKASTLLLEQERLDRIAKGVPRSKANRSALVVEAVMKAFGSSKS